MVIRSLRFAAMSVVGVFFLLIPLGFHGTTVKADKGRNTQIEVELSEAFYKALRAENTKTYKTTDKSEEYLRQIAVSSRFAMESNLKIINQQKRMIELLEEIKKQN